jgi:LuxR family quorum-sensing system transcriptional regulator CciR
MIVTARPPLETRRPRPEEAVERTSVLGAPRLTRSRTFFMTFDRIDAFVRALGAATTRERLQDALADISRELGFSFFALTHHVDIAAAARSAIRLHNYPSDWEEYFDAQGLGTTDPVHRASHRTSIAFAWSNLAELIALTPRDRSILALAERRGIGNGFTVPANVPGESNGSCSFAVPAGTPLDAEQRPTVQVVGAFAFEAARRLWHGTCAVPPSLPRLTDRQRDCVLLLARGKTDWEIARILGLRPDTVVQYVKRARERYGVASRTQLAVSVLLDGTISFEDVLAR